jgi:UDPglucose--hexose-1-phosphate uridylyltransferase
MCAELRRDVISGCWIITKTKEKEEFFESLEPRVRVKEKPCPFCPGNEKETPNEIYALRNPGTMPGQPGWSVRVFPSKEKVLEVEKGLERRGVGIYDAMNNVGAHELIIESPEHIKNLSDLPNEQIKRALSVYQNRIIDLRGDKRLRYAIVFKNQRPSSPFRLGHTHSQLVALPLTPQSVKEELENAKNYYREKERCVFCDVVREELEAGLRIVEENKSFISYVPFAPRLPFETWILPKRHNADFTQEDENTLFDLAVIMKVTLSKICKLLDDPPLNYMIHSIPYMRPRAGYWKTIHKDYHWHLEILPHIVRVEGFSWSSGFYIEPLCSEVMTELLRETKI